MEWKVMNWKMFMWQRMARIWAGAREAITAGTRSQRGAAEEKASELRTASGPRGHRPHTWNGNGTFQTRWDARWQVIRARHPVCWVRHLPTGREKVIHREKLRWVSPDVDSKDTADTNSGSDGELRPNLRSTSHEAGDKEMEVCQPGLSCMNQSETMQCGNGQSWVTDNSDRKDTESESQGPKATLQPETCWYPARKRRPPAFLGWEDWPTTRGRLATLDFWQLQ